MSSHLKQETERGWEGRERGGQSRGSLETQICTPSREFVSSLGTHFRSNDYLGVLIQVSCHVTVPCILSTGKSWLLVFTNSGQKNIGRCLFWLSTFPRAGETVAPPADPGLDLKKFVGQ